MPSETIKPEDKSTIKKALAGKKILTATVARLYVASPNQNVWTYTKIMGAVAFVKDKDSFFFKIVDLAEKDNRGILWEQELYKDFVYTEELDFFHTFALDECLAAFSFASEKEAKNFYKKVTNKEKLPSKSKSQKEKENKNGGGFFKRKKEKKGKISTADIGDPKDFRHLGHIGWDERKGFDVQNINPEWGDVISQLGDYGISEELIAKNPEFINQFLEENKKEQKEQNKSAKKEKGPPPPPPSRKKNPPPPPPSRKPVTPTRNNNTFQPSSGVKHSISPPVSPSFSPRVSPTPPPPPPTSAPSLLPLTPPTLPSRQQPVVAPPPPPPPVRSSTSNIAPPPIPPARVTYSNSVPPPLPQTRSPSTGGSSPPPPPPPPPPQVGGAPPPPPVLSRESPQQNLPPTTDVRSNLMEAIRNRGGVSGGGLRNVGEPVRQSTFTEESSNPSGNDSNLAKTLADALKKLNKDLGSDDSEIEEDDDWDTE